MITSCPEPLGVSSLWWSHHLI